MKLKWFLWMTQRCFSSCSRESLPRPDGPWEAGPHPVGHLLIYMTYWDFHVAAAQNYTLVKAAITDILNILPETCYQWFYREKLLLGVWPRPTAQKLRKALLALTLAQRMYDSVGREDSRGAVHSILCTEGHKWMVRHQLEPLAKAIVLAENYLMSIGPEAEMLKSVWCALGACVLLRPLSC